MKKKFIIILVVLMVLFGLFALYSWKKGGELLFDMEKINGVSNNNPYEIRNDVYDFLIKEIEESKIQELKEEKIKNLFLNFVKSDLVVIKNFSNKSRSIEISLNTMTIMGCFYELEKNEKYHKTLEFFEEKFIRKTENTKSEYSLILESSDDIKMIVDITEYYLNGMTLNPRERNPFYHPELCDRYLNSVLEESEFW